MLAARVQPGGRRRGDLRSEGPRDLDRGRGAVDAAQPRGRAEQRRRRVRRRRAGGSGGRPRGRRRRPRPTGSGRAWQIAEALDDQEKLDELRPNRRRGRRPPARSARRVGSTSSTSWKPTSGSTKTVRTATEARRMSVTCPQRPRVGDHRLLRPVRRAHRGRRPDPRPLAGRIGRRRRRRGRGDDHRSDHRADRCRSMRSCCPRCQTPRRGDDRFCEVDGYDFVAGADAVDTRRLGGASSPPTARTTTRSLPTTSSSPTSYEPRTFSLDADEVLVGRRSASRGIEPDDRPRRITRRTTGSRTVTRYLIRSDDGSYVARRPRLHQRNVDQRQHRRDRARRRRIRSTTATASTSARGPRSRSVRVVDTTPTTDRPRRPIDAVTSFVAPQREQSCSLGCSAPSTPA